MNKLPRKNSRVRLNKTFDLRAKRDGSGPLLEKGIIGTVAYRSRSGTCWVRWDMGYTGRMHFDHFDLVVEQEKMRRLEVPVVFTGCVSVEVPAHLSIRDAEKLATKVAAARILATDVNPDAPEDVACDEYGEECSAKAKKTFEADWDACKTTGVGGDWTAYRADKPEN